MTSGAIRFIGIDFSGAVRPWLPRVSNPRVLIATVEATGQHLTVQELRPAQDLPGSGDGFSKLVNWLGEGKFAAAAIDAPFSIPAVHIPDSEHAELVRRVGLRFTFVDLRERRADGVGRSHEPRELEFSRI